MLQNDIHKTLYQSELLYPVLSLIYISPNLLVIPVYIVCTLDIYVQFCFHPCLELQICDHWNMLQLFVKKDMFLLENMKKLLWMQFK